MKINTLSQNNPAFGVRMSIKEATISKLRNQIAEKPQLPADGSILGRIYYKIMNTKQKDSSLISFFQDIASSNKKLKKLLEKSGKTLERAFWETCNKFFDVQLVVNDKDKNVDNISDAKIKEDSYLIRIFHPIKNIEEKRKQIIEYCIKNYSEAKDNRNAFCEEVKKELNLNNMQAKSIQISILGPIIRLPGHYNEFKKNAIQGKEQTFTEFKEYLKNKAPNDNNRLYNSGNGELLAYTIETFKKYVPEFKEEFVFAEETQANNNSTIADAGTELLLYALKKLRAINKTTNDSTIEKNNDTTQTNINPRANIKRTHELDSSEPKAMDNFTNCFDTLIKVAQLNSPKDNTEKNNDAVNEKQPHLAEKTVSDSFKSPFNILFSQLFTENQNNECDVANEKRPHLAEKPVSDSFKSPFDILFSQLFTENQNNECEVYNNKDALNDLNDNKVDHKDTSDEIQGLNINNIENPYSDNMFANNTQHVIPNQDAPILSNLNNNSNNVQQKKVNMSANNRQHLFPNQNAPILPNLNNNSNNVQQKNVYEIHTNNIKKNNVSKKRERQKIAPQTRKMMIAYSLFKGYYNTSEITNNINKDLNITVTEKSMYNILTPMHKLDDIYNLFKNDKDDKYLPKTIENFRDYVNSNIKERYKQSPIINKEEIFYFTVAAMANVFEGKIQFENSLTLEDANEDVKKCFDELKYRGIKNDIILT